MPDDRSRAKEATLGIAASVAGAAAGLALPGPLGVILASASPPALEFFMNWTDSVLTPRRLQNVQGVLLIAAKEAGLDPEELVRRVDAGGDRGEVFMRTLRAAQDAGTMRTLVALALSLANVAGSSEDAAWSREAALIRAVEDLNGADVQILRSFTDPRKLFGDGVGQPLEDEPPPQILEATLVRRFPEIGDTVWAVVAKLQAYGLIVRAGGSGTLRPPTGWSTTSFGNAFVDRITTAEHYLRAPVEGTE